MTITSEESAALAITLAEHLQEEAITLYAPVPDRWYLQDNSIPSMTTTSLATSTGRDVRQLLPKGADSARWHRIMTELQMLLHAHPVNDARETRGQRPVNSVWLWGGGTLPAPGATLLKTVWSSDWMISALAHHNACALEPLPERIALETWKVGSHFLSFEALETHLRSGNAQAWSNTVTLLNRDWFIPLLSALQARQLRSLTIISSDESGTRRFVIRPGDLIKFWRKNKYLQ